MEMFADWPTLAASGMFDTWMLCAAAGRMFEAWMMCAVGGGRKKLLKVAASVVSLKVAASVVVAERTVLVSEKTAVGSMLTSISLGASA